MKPHYSSAEVQLFHGDCLEVLRGLPDASVHAVVTDPPYGIGFMGKQWDQPGRYGSTRRGRTRNQPITHGAIGVDHHKTTERGASMVAGDYDISPSGMRSFQAWCEAWAIECLRILKPGGYLLSFGSSRTWHRLASGIEDAGFEMRDSIAWLYGSGFPKSLNLGGEWEGWGTALKPSFEPIVVARKPLAGTVRGNVAAHGTGALNIDASRIHTQGSEHKAYTVKRLKPGATLNKTGGRWRPDGDDAPAFEGTTKDGRWPTNVLLDESQARVLDDQTGTLRSGMMRAGTAKQGKAAGIYGAFAPQPTVSDTYGYEGGASRFFPVFRYEAKASGIERPASPASNTQL